MPRIRSVHPSLFTDEAWVSCSPVARVLYIGLMCEADDQGLFEWKPLQIKMRLLPGDNVDVVGLLSELTSANLIAELCGGGKRLGAIRYFRRFQRPKKPNSMFVLPEKWRTYVGLSSDGSDLPQDDEGEVTHQFPTSSELSEQKEDGGGDKEEDSQDADASLSPAKPTTYPADFEACWLAYPHVRGRSSKRKTFGYWRRIKPPTRQALPSAIARYARDGREPKEECGAPAMERWLRDERFMDWLAEDTPQRQRPVFPDPEIRDAIISAKSEAFVRSFLDPCTWDPDNRLIAPRTGEAARRLREVGRVIEARRAQIGEMSS